MNNEFTKLLNQKNPDFKYFLFKKDDLINYFCRNKYCQNGRDIFYDNPEKKPVGRKGWRTIRTKKAIYRATPHQAYKTPPNLQGHVNKLTPQEASIYEEYKSNLMLLKGNANIILRRSKCYGFCKTYVNAFATKEYNKFRNERDGRNKEKMFLNYYNNGIGCEELYSNPGRANHTKGYYCRKFWVFNGNSCNAKFGYAADMGCKFYDIGQEFPGGLSPIDKADLRFSVFNHSKKYFKKFGLNCNSCGGKSNDYKNKFCNQLDFLRKDCILKFGKQRALCYRLMERKKVECNRNSINGCYAVCRVHNKRHFLLRSYSSNHPKEFYCENTGQCEKECSRLNDLYYYCDSKDYSCMNIYRTNCKRYCENVVTQQIRIRKMNSQGHDFKIANFVARLKASQNERIKYDSQNEYQSRRMSELYNRDSLKDAIYLMEDSIYLEQNEIIQEKKMKRTNYEKEMAQKVMLFFKNQKDFKKGKNILNVFDL